VTGWRLLARHHGGVAAEVAAATSMVAPLAAARSRRHSVTFRAAFGCVAMTVPDDPAWVALTLAHEVQHAKLSVVTDVVRLIEPGDGRFYAPWRPDARPAESLLQGIYAHLGVAGFWRRQRRREADADRRLHAETEFVHWLHACLEAAATLRNGGRLTPAGDRFVATMECTLRRWDTEDVSPAAVAAARATTEEHRAQWRLGQPDRAPAAVPDR
jgi:HEXXH motif-containing protein